MVLWLVFKDFYPHIYLYDSEKDHYTWLCRHCYKCTCASHVCEVYHYNLGCIFLKLRTVLVFFFFFEKGDKMTGQKFVPLHIGGSLGIYSNSLANLLFLNTGTRTYCPLSCLACHLENARQSKMYTASVKRTTSAGVSAGISKNNVRNQT